MTRTVAVFMLLSAGLEFAMDQKGAKTAAAARDEGIKLLDQEQFAQAIEMFSAALRAPKPNPDVYHYRCLAKYGLGPGHYDSALPDCQQFTILDSGDKSGWMDYGTLQL